MTRLIDPERIAELNRVLPEPLAEVVAELVQNVDQAIERAAQAVEVGRLDDAARAAHGCRNDALIVGARPLLRALANLETAANNGQREGAAQALANARETWPQTRLELQRTAQAAN